MTYTVPAGKVWSFKVGIKEIVLSKRGTDGSVKSPTRTLWLFKSDTYLLLATIQIAKLDWTFLYR